MNLLLNRGAHGAIQGQLLRRSVRREVAIFLRDGVLWVADFVDGEGQLIEATTWFRFNCAASSSRQARLRMIRESAAPLSADLVQRIQRLQHPVAKRKVGALDRLVAAIAARSRGGRGC